VVEKEEIQTSFHEELQWIKDENLRDKVVEVWLEASKQGKWKSLKEVPFTLLFEESGCLVDHTKRVTRLAKAVMDQRDEDINQDILIAGALLHDVWKLLEYTIKDGRVVKSEYGKVFRHPVSGALLAKKTGLPDEVIHIIYAHSHEGDNTKRSIEAYIVHHCDFIDFHIRKTQVES